MPMGDRTGPAGMGPLTGRRMGYCAGFNAPGYMNGPGYFCGRGFFGRGRGYRNMFYLTGLPGWARYGYPAYGAADGTPDEVTILKSQQKALEEQLKRVQERLNQLNKKEKEE